MRIPNNYIASILLLLCLFTACKDEEKASLEALMTQIRADYDAERDSDCLIGIDTLRNKYPKAIAERKEALGIYQKAQLRIAQKDLARTDSALEVEKVRFVEMEKAVNAHKAAGVATATELTGLTRQRMLRDSLQVQFDVLCAKIKYIHKRQKQL